MKLVPPDQRKAISAVRLALSVVAVSLKQQLLYASPTWWSQRNVVVQSAVPDDYAPANQGQLKNIAKAAIAEMDAKLTGGAGEELHNLANSWSTPAAPTNDFAPVNLGQLKKVARPFYDRLIALGIVDYYPWLSSPNLPDDFAVANIGQVKNLFSFEIPSGNLLNDPRTDRLAAGQFSASIALEENAAWIWNDHLSNGSEFDRDYPHRISGLPGIRSVSAGERYLVALANDGSVWTWGDNAVGQLDDGTNIGRNIPAAVPNLGDIVSAKAGAFHVLALRGDGTLVAWGDNYYGQLGTGDTTPSPIFMSIPSLDNVQKIAASYGKSAALKTDGTVWIWGYERYNGQDIFHTNPAAVPELLDVVDIAAGYEHMVAVKSDGTVRAWGSNYANQIANGYPWWKYQDVPFQVPNLPPIVKVASSYDHTLAIANDGTVWAWGYNFDGQLGDGTTNPRQTPVQASGLTDVIAVATAYTYSLAMKSDGTVWAWGDGAVGTLPGTDRHVPQQVGLGVFDTNHNGMDDRWEIHYLGNLNQSGDADFDGDGISNRLEYLRGTDPTDYYNGAKPVVEIASGNNQIGDPGAFLAKPLRVRVKSAAGNLLTNAPVIFNVSGGVGGLAASPGMQVQQQFVARSDSNGEVTAYQALPDAAGTSIRTAATAGIGTQASSVTFRSIVRFSQGTPTPPPNPSATPAGSPSPSATPNSTPIAPYRYAIIDLGPGMYPTRINKKGTILVGGPDPGREDGWGYGLWRGGSIEWLRPPDSCSSVAAGDLNDRDTVAGNFSSCLPISDNERELNAGFIWLSTSATPTKISGAGRYPGWGPYNFDIYTRSFLVTVINNLDDAYGQMLTGTVRGFLYRSLFVWNSAHCPAGASAPSQLSNEAAVNDDPDDIFLSSWSGSSDTIVRASSEHYIGSKVIPDAKSVGFTIGGRSTGMIDGQSVDFRPVDINETGLVVGLTSDADMIIHSLARPPLLPIPDVTLGQSESIAINDHTRPAPPLDAQSSPTASPQPTAIPAPQILSWTGNALVLWELQPDGPTWHPFGLEEMIPSMDGWDALTPYDMNDNGLIIGTAWYKDPSNPAAPSELHGFLLVPCDLMVDGNRDGKMSFDDQTVQGADQTSEDTPYRFWVNDDQDAGSGTNGSEEVTPVQLRDNQDEKIQSVRDCEDLTRLWLNIKGLTESFKTGALKFVLKFRNITSGNPAVRVFRAAENGGRGYITNEGWGALQASPPFDTALPGTNGPGIASSTTGIHVHRQFWQGIDEVNPVINLLFEGVEEGEGALYCEIVSEDGRRVGTSPGIRLDIKNVQKMYERAKAQPENIAAPYSAFAPFTGPVTYVSDPDGQPFQKPWYETDQCLVFVHGWNVSYDEYRGVAQTLFKRLWHQGFKGHFASLRWDTRKSDGMFDAGEYNRSENRAYGYAAALKQWATILSNGYTVSVLAHSMGNIVCSEALRQGLQIRNYVLMEAAIPMSCYAADATRLPRLEDRDRDYPTPDYHRNPTTNELTLGYRAYLPPVTANMVNFYNEDDWALATGTTEIIPGLPQKETNWETNQLDYKPDGEIPDVVHAVIWRYYYDPALPPILPLTQRAWTESTFRRLVSDSWEMKAFVARSRTKAVGAFPNGNTVFTANVNLHSPPYNFGRQRLDHSGQFTRNIQEVDALYNAIRKALEQ